MRKNIVFIVVFIITIFIYFMCLSRFFFSFYYTIESGDDYYHSNVSQRLFILNYGRNIKSVNYCFTDEKKCDDYLTYDGDLSKRILNLSIDYPDSQEGKRICVKIVSDNNFSVNCSDDIYVVDSLEPVILPLYDEIVLDGTETNLESLFEVKSNTGIKNFECNFNDSKNENVSIDCMVIGNNNLKAYFNQKVYINDFNKLESKKILFAGDSITQAVQKLDKYGGWASRVGFSNYMDWYNSGLGGATISNGDKHITDQIIDNKDGNFDYIILQGGINDMHDEVKLGDISDSFEVDDFNNESYAGGLEELFYYTKKYNPNAKIGFIITYQTPNSDWGENVRDRSKQTELTRQICDKWEIPYLDLYDGVVYENGKSKTFSEILKVETGEYFYNEDSEEVHLARPGYDIISKYISIWIKTL